MPELGLQVLLLAVLRVMPDYGLQVLAHHPVFNAFPVLPVPGLL